MIRRSFFATAALAATLVAGSAQAEDMTLLSSWDESYNAVPVFAQGFAERLEEKSDGDLNINLRGPETVSPSSSFSRSQPACSTCCSPMAPITWARRPWPSAWMPSRTIP
ncbi:hypothetical protein [Fodinicurvata halophila]|uniref:hypothetical protein n=1 Tax=Fodinicurvata halophila TaxID=1419723 RepID=UPI00362D447A